MYRKVKSKIKEVVKTIAWFFIDLYFYRFLPHGINILSDIRRKARGYRMSVIFDVGANVGQSSKEYIRRYPTAQIVCFEPIRATFGELQNNLKKFHNVQFHQLALGAIQERVKIILQPSSVENSLLNRANTATLGKTNNEIVEVETLDTFCANHNIDHIDFLKIDTEGYDLNVLKGGNAMLEAHKVSFIQVEAGMSPFNKSHASFEDLKAYLESKDYFLFGIYGQALEWSGKPRLRFCNAVFLSSDVIKTYEKHK
ncbi:MAG: FkbM family methyltransferase [Anaerolineales bacterium]